MIMSLSGKGNALDHLGKYNEALDVLEINLNNNSS